MSAPVDTQDTDTQQQEHIEETPGGHTGEDFALDLGDSIAPVVVFLLLTALAAMFGAVADPLPVQLTAGLVTVTSGLASIRSMRRCPRRSALRSTNYAFGDDDDCS